MSAYLPCKNPHLRSIGVGKENNRKIQSFGNKGRDYFISWVFTGMCSLDVGWEAAIHAMYLIFKNENTDSVPLIDAENSIDAFHSINREVFIHFVKIFALLLLHLFQIAIPAHLDYLLLEVVNENSQNVQHDGTS